MPSTRQLILTGLVAVVLALPCLEALAEEDVQVTFDRLHAQWNKVDKRMDELIAAFPKASDAEKKEHRKSYKDLVVRARKLKPVLEGAALAVVRAKGMNTGKAAAEVVFSLAALDEHQAQYDKALASCRLLLKHGLERGREKQGADVYRIAGLAAYGADAYGEAEVYLQKAQALETLKPLAAARLQDALTARSLWVKEEAIRAAEAKADDLPRVVFETSKGLIVLQLFENEAPQAVASFINLVEQGFYDALPFHRVLQGFGAQTGDGSNEPSYRLVKEAGAAGARKHFRGSLTLAAPRKEFDLPGAVFLCFKRQAHLDGKHTVFGRVSEGFETLSKLQIIDPEVKSSAKPDVIKTARVLRKRDHAYVAKKLPVAASGASKGSEQKSSASTGANGK